MTGSTTQRAGDGKLTRPPVRADEATPGPGDRFEAPHARQLTSQPPGDSVDGHSGARHPLAPTDPPE